MPRQTRRAAGQPPDNTADHPEKTALPVPSASSSPASFVTAAASPRNPQDATLTELSTPDGASTTDSGYRKAKSLPSELRQHCQIYLEEALPLISLSLLTNLETRDEAVGSYCPPVNQLAFLAGIAIHPDFTSRPKEPTWTHAAAESLEYLYSVLASIGPVNARFDEAFRFGSTSSSFSSRGRSPAGSSESDEDDGSLGDDFFGATESGGSAVVGGKYTASSIWRRAQDFFSVVGWAFNCSVLYPNRWLHYRPWLEFMFEAIEADLDERYRLDLAAADDDEEADRGGEDFPMLRRSMLARFIAQRGGRAGGGGLKWIMKALFADGDKSASSLFQEVWLKEHKGMSLKALNKRKRAAVNLDKGDYGGWLDDDSVFSSQGSEPPTPQKRRTNSDLGAGKTDLQALEASFVESVPFRHRLFSMLSFLACYLPSAPFELPDLYENFERGVRSLPLPIFSEMIDNTAGKLREDSHISLLQGILSLLMPSSALAPRKVDRARDDAGGTSPAILERCFLPNAANTITAEDNAKVSLLLEALMRIVIVDGTERFSPGLRDAVQSGVDARENKAKRKKTRGRPSGAPSEDPDAEARAVLELSGQRLLMLAEIAAVDGDDDDYEEENPGSDVEMESGGDDEG
ncbi:uncharacterized protein B0I36DRAFT_359853 [Microdochium trichocladiopsis]|uniref:Uncharacterized protein n=1 Tax=Microdochium trichocladiopsis TaxID=1682393 RepID=A0A9P8YCK1_9PEZI|nr:uncharacterized protein B0I36DRAFT_359853 [Microdochium trichocladiopsis]KAH7038266.1 hypothetical protein B0I36DRAFT_359853 [Microdochium trichocladiopsis]